MRFLIDGSAGVSYCDTGIGAYAETLIRGLAQNPVLPDSVSVLTAGEIHSLSTYGSLPRETLPTFWQTNEKQSEATVPASFDLYHNTQNGIGMPRFSGRKIITVHDMIPMLLPAYCGSPYRELFAEHCLKNAAAADAIITVSRQSKSDLVQYGGIAPEKITVIYEAPKTCCRYRSPTFAAGYLYKKFGIKPPFFLYVGGFNPRKNLSGLFKAMQILKKQRITIPLVIPAVASSRCESYRKQAVQLGIAENTRFPSPVRDWELSLFYSSCIALVYPSFYEGFGLPPLEAAACKAPTILSDIPVHREIMAAAAYYIDPHDPGSIADALLTLAENSTLRQKLATAAFYRSRRFRMEKTAAQTLKLYREVCR